MHIFTPRLRLLALSTGQLQRYLDDPAGLEVDLGFPASHAILTETVCRAIGMKLIKMKTAPLENHPWYTYWMIITLEPLFGAGLIGYKGIDSGKEEVEIGYGIDPGCQGRGYTSEAARALVSWAFEDPACQAIVARKTLKTNTASLRLLNNLGFEVVAEYPNSLDLRLVR